ncbi:uncharacterized protein LOC128727662 [Anopheles nili]|uniref:uncharacterized protein LOC128727662 n=1 Tax=Anopheles nili TaxID=185578 RepID=UPI00237A7017|nr:uncharacterized protein LOC128727662 [Anopheles nili]
MNAVHNILLSNEDCEKIIAADKSTTNELVKIIKYEPERIPGKPGYLGEYTFLDIYFEVANGSILSQRYFAKSLPYHDQVLTTAVEEWGIFRKETELYCQIFNQCVRNTNKVIKWSPECFLARNNLLVMEDLTRMGFKTISFQTTFNEHHIKLVLDRLAQMHACSFEYEINRLEGQSIGSLFNELILFETTFTESSGWFMAGLKGIEKIALERNRYAIDPSKKSVIQNRLWDCMKQIFSLAECTTKFRSVVVHRDLWFNNIMFKCDCLDAMCEEPKECILIDFQLARYLPPAVDFLCALYLLTDSEHRKRFEKTHVEYYYASLQRKLAILGLDGAAILSREQFEKSLDHYRLMGFVWTGVLHGFVNFPQGVLDKLHHHDPKTYTRMSMENRDDFILKYYDEDRYFRERLDDIVTELLQFLFNFS